MHRVQVGDRVAFEGDGIGQPRTEGVVVGIESDSGNRLVRIRWASGWESVLFADEDPRIVHPLPRRAQTA